MNCSYHSKTTTGRVAGGISRSLLMITGLVAIALAVAVMVRRGGGDFKTGADSGDGPALTDAALASRSPVDGSRPGTQNAAFRAQSPESRKANPSDRPTKQPSLSDLPRPEPTPDSRLIVEALTKLDVSEGRITPTQAAVWNESLRALVAQGEAAVPAIREFLEKNLDLNFGTLEGASMGQPTLRMALLKAMQEIGGEQAIAGSLHTLQTTADPAELALVSVYLQQADAAQYGEAVLGAAREALSMAASGRWDGRDVAPLFDVLKTFGGAGTAQEIERYANTWFNYAPLVLAELPEGAGIPSLVRLAMNADGQVTLGREIYQRMLAQVAQQSTDAAEALAQLAAGNKIEPNSWQAVADTLAGASLEISQAPISKSTTPGNSQQLRLYHVHVGNQNYVEQPPPQDMPKEQVSQRIQLIDRILSVTSHPIAQSNLNRARASLLARL